MRTIVLLRLCIVAILVIGFILIIRKTDPFFVLPNYLDYYVKTSDQTLSIPSIPAGSTLHDIVFFTFNGQNWVPFPNSVINRLVDTVSGISYSISSTKKLKKKGTIGGLTQTQAVMPQPASIFPNGITINGLGNVGSISSKSNSNRPRSPNLVVRLVFTSSYSSSSAPLPAI
jgi:hypothetical protein